jgi:hypothetical protein
VMARPKRSIYLRAEQNGTQELLHA